MSQITVKITTDNDAFKAEGGDQGAEEAARILRVAADAIEDCPNGEMEMSLRDINGNRVGFIKWED